MHIHTQTQTYSDTDRYIQTHSHTQAHGHTQRQTYSHTHRHIVIHKDTDRHR